MIDKQKTSGGLGFLGALQIAFIVLKLCGVISWSWFWVLSILIAEAAVCGVALGAFLIYLVLVGIRQYKDKQARATRMASRKKAK